MNSPDFAPLLAAAVSAADRGAEFIRSRAGDVHRIDWREKRQADFVTEVDTGAEERIRARLEELVPGCSIVGEELSPSGLPSAGVTFVVDPLDGTTNFLHGYPQYAVSIAALQGGTLVAGVIVDVTRGEHFTATLGGGAFRGRARIAVSATTDPTRALVGTGFPFTNPQLLDDFQPQFARIVRATSGVRRAGSAALDLADVACGRFDAFWELSLAPWDIAAGILLIREAGGRVSDLTGRDSVVEHTPLVASNSVLHDWMVEILAGTGDAPPPPRHSSPPIPETHPR